ncbi:hypothetical protein KQX62_16065 [Rhodopseudomonas palustris]|uniref:RiboL-PSP-HEPN domain-containing protein n=1 Tax=Rhodopseudomonas palustris TaxID=1076 RepID=A0AAX3DU98_RHOPL|nr:hypothetical protein [Rhodopseudomonas palustris]UYO38243.1 hypothetical protein KQX62_16065 [Rhodopseudomonas palustris]
MPRTPIDHSDLEAIARLAQEDWNLPHLHNKPLEEVAASFRSNFARLRMMMSFPTAIVGSADSTRRAHDLSEFELTKQLGRELSHEETTEIERRAHEILEHRHQQYEDLRNTPDWLPTVLSYHTAAAHALSGLTETPIGAFAYRPMLHSYLIATWTTIETMFGDLWEAALNTHPRTLAALNGAPRRQQHGKPQTKDPKQIDLNIIAKHNFDLRETMGTIFRSERRFEFTRLSSTREAYFRAFSERATRIETALNSKYFDALSTVRNVLVHRSGKADDEYARLQSSLPIPRCLKHDEIPLSGVVTSTLIKNAVTSSKNLLNAVDDWVSNN